MPSYEASMVLVAEKSRDVAFRWTGINCLQNVARFSWILGARHVPTMAVQTACSISRLWTSSAPLGNRDDGTIVQVIVDGDWVVAVRPEVTAAPMDEPSKSYDRGGGTLLLTNNGMEWKMTNDYPTIDLVCRQSPNRTPVDREYAEDNHDDHQRAPQDSPQVNATRNTQRGILVHEMHSLRWIRDNHLLVRVAIRVHSGGVKGTRELLSKPFHTEFIDDSGP